MKLLIDECVPRRIKSLLTEWTSATVQEMKWSGIRNGSLLKLATAEGFTVFVTLDEGLKFQQNLSRVTIAVAVLRARSNRFADIEPLVPALKLTLGRIRPGEVIFITGSEKPSED